LKLLSSNFKTLTPKSFFFSKRAFSFFIFLIALFIRARDNSEIVLNPNLNAFFPDTLDESICSSNCTKINLGF